MDTINLDNSEEHDRSKAAVIYPPVSLDTDICEKIFESLPIPTEKLFKEKVNEILRAALKL